MIDFLKTFATKIIWAVMFKAERTDKILEFVRQREFTSVDELVRWFNYSPATIRRDLNYLADLGLIQKSYGSVCAKAGRPTLIREHDNVGAKVRICERAADFIKDGDVVFIDGTTTTYFLGEKLLKKKGLTVVTTNMKLAMFLGEHKVNCYLTGGKVCDTTMLAGDVCTDLVEKMRFDVAVFSPGIIDKEGHLAVYEGFWGFMRSAMKNCKKNILVCDLKKLEKKSSYFAGNIGMFDVVIFDDEFPDTISQAYPDVECIIAK